MGESDRYHKQDKFNRKGSRFTLGADSNALTALFAINVIFFLVLMIIQVGMFAGSQTPEDFSSKIVPWFSVPANLTKLSERPWTILTYMFTDTGSGVIRLISNMIWLWAFGYILQQMAGNDKIIPVYIYGGLTGGVFFIVAYHLMPVSFQGLQFDSVIGANAAVLSVAMATTTLNPDFRFFRQIRNGIPIWVLTGIYILIDFAGVTGFGAAFSISHLGGAVAGFLFVVFLRKGYDGSVWMNRFWRWLMNLFTPAPPKNTDIKNKIFYTTGDAKPFTKAPNLTQKRVDEILDKINREGYHFLTDEEKAFLKKASEEDLM